MPKLSLPPPDVNASTSLRNAEDASAWLAAQANGQNLRLIRALLPEIRGIDTCIATPTTRLEMLDVLRPALIEAEEGIEARYAHKPLPMMGEELAIFTSAWQLWHAFAIAYLRAVPLLPPAQMVIAMHRAAIALREALHCHYIARIEADPGLLPLLYELLVTAESMRMQRTPVTDPHLRYLGESTVAGDITWAMLLHFADPYRFSPAQFAVANRALSRWRDLANFQSQPDEDPKAKALALERWIAPENFADGGPKWLEVKQVIRKLRKRVEALEAGETPEELKLGRDLTGAACVRLLRDIDHLLRPHPKTISDRLEEPTADLVFGHANLYALLSGKELGAGELSSKSSAISHERMAVFGFDNAANRVDIAKPVEVPCENWAVEDEWLLRAAPAGAQVMTPALIGIKASAGDTPRLAILGGLRQTADGWLAANIRLLPTPAATGIQKTASVGTARATPLQPAFFLPGDEKAEIPQSICLPTGAGVREGSLMALDEAPVNHLRLTELLERGNNFVRFAYART